MFNRVLLLLLIFVVALGVSGCFHGQFGSIPPPPALGGTKSNPVTMMGECGTKQTEILGENDVNKRKAIRNDEVNRLIMAIRQSHDLYNGRVSMHRTTFDTASDLTLLGSTAVSAINPGVAIGATSTAITGAKASVEKNFYSDLSRTALLLDIYKNTQAQEDVIVQKLATKSYAEYSMSDACRDLDSFYRAGSALRAVSAQSAAPAVKPNF